jgi:hypothetical protein
MSEYRFTAWITTDATCVTNGHCDVVVLIDEITAYSEGPNGDEIPEWESTGPEVFSAVTAIPCDGDHEDATGEAETLLNTAGWHRTSDWEGVPTGYIATVAR